MLFGGAAAGSDVGDDDAGENVGYIVVEDGGIER